MDEKDFYISDIFNIVGDKLELKPEMVEHLDNINYSEKINREQLEKEILNRAYTSLEKKYGRKLTYTEKEIQACQVKIPYKEVYVPDWDYMESFIESIERECIKEFIDIENLGLPWWMIDGDVFTSWGIPDSQTLLKNSSMTLIKN